MVNQQFAFAVHILCLLALADGAVGSQTLARSVHTNPVVVRRLLLALQNAGLIKTFSGKFGGSILRKSPAKISLLEIYDAVEPRPAIETTRRKLKRNCAVSCGMHEIMCGVSAGAERAMRRHLRAQPLAKILRRIG